MYAHVRSIMWNGSNFKDTVERQTRCQTRNFKCKIWQISGVYALDGKCHLVHMHPKFVIFVWNFQKRNNFESLCNIYRLWLFQVSIFSMRPKSVFNEFSSFQHLSGFHGICSLMKIVPTWMPLCTTLVKTKLNYYCKIKAQ